MKFENTKLYKKLQNLKVCCKLNKYQKFQILNLFVQNLTIKKRAKIPKKDHLIIKEPIVWNDMSDEALDEIWNFMNRNPDTKYLFEPDFYDIPDGKTAKLKEKFQIRFHTIRNRKFWLNLIFFLSVKFEEFRKNLSKNSSLSLTELKQIVSIAKNSEIMTKTSPQNSIIFENPMTIDEETVSNLEVCAEPSARKEIPVLISLA